MRVRPANTNGGIACKTSLKLALLVNARIVSVASHSPSSHIAKILVAMMCISAAMAVRACISFCTKVALADSMSDWVK